MGGGHGWCPICRPESRGTTYIEVYSVTSEATGALVAELSAFYTMNHDVDPA